MKKTLTILALMIAVAGAGQKDSTIGGVNYTLGNGLKLGTVTGEIHIDGDSLYYFKMPPKYDTIPILYLYADTARLMSVMPSAYILNGKLFEVNDTAYYPPDYKTFWDFGYEVREETGLIPVTSRENNMLYDWVMSYKLVGYLDRQKQPMRKSIVIFIFMTKTIEKWQPR